MIRSSEVYLRDFLPNGLASVLIKSDYNPIGETVEGCDGSLFLCKNAKTTMTPGWFRAELAQERDFLGD